MKSVLAAALAVVAMAAGAAAQSADRSCTACHGELEFLRQHAPSLEAAERMRVTGGEIAASAHSGTRCAECHTGFTRWPHPESVNTQSCRSCHEEADQDWHVGVHGNPEGVETEPTECVDCHSIHQVATVQDLREGPAMQEMNARCVDCHEASAFPEFDPHRDTVPCASCHVPHATQDVDEPGAAVAPLAQMETCGACHQETAETARVDAHGRALAEEDPRGLATMELMGNDVPPTCTSCHGAHGMRAMADSLVAEELVNQCSECHQDYADRYYGTYHGKATALGSHIVATCSDCHAAHAIYPADEAASSVHPDQLVETCAECHEASRPAFVQYDSHPDPMDRDRNAPLFLSFVFMNTLLIGVLIVFGLHTLLWWVRIWLDHRPGKEEEESHA